MSVSLALVPVALALRVIMGKERFQSWIDSMQLKIPTTFRDEGDLVSTIRKAGHDAEKWGGSYKTHIAGEKLWFFWEQVDGVWTAIFGTSDPRQAIFAFIQDVEAKAGRQIFEWEQPGQAPRVLASKTFPTNFRDPELLRNVLREYGLAPVFNKEGVMVWEMNGMTLIFRQEGDQPFSLEVKNVADTRQIYASLDDINDTYTGRVQQRTYDNLKNRIKDRGLIIVDETRSPDESIVLTLSIQN
ncbi:MAG: hypothetical protein JXA87_01870 [Thermoleophilia bacterium]|nr:hypothetical protein [Thermoleophilia bacterium]